MSELKKECENVKREEFNYSRYKVNDQFIELMTEWKDEFQTTGFKISKPVRKSLRWLTERTLLKQFAPAAVVVNELGHIQFIHGQTGMFLEPVPGYHGISNVLKMTRPGIRRELATALKEAVAQQRIVYTPELSIQTYGGHLLVNLTVGPLENYAQEPALYIIIFENGTKEQSKRTPSGNERYPINLDEKSNIQVNKDEYKDMLKLERTICSKSKQLSEIESELEIHNEMFEISKNELQALSEILDKAKNDIEMNEKLIEISKENLKTVNEKLVSDRSEWKNNQILLETSSTELQSVYEKLALSKTELENENHFLKIANEELHKVQEKLAFDRSELERKDHLIVTANEELRITEEKLAFGKSELEQKDHLLLIANEELQKVNEKLKLGERELTDKNNRMKTVAEELQRVQDKLQFDKSELGHSDHLLEVANNELQRVNEKLLLGQSELENNDYRLKKGKEELELTNEKLILLKSELASQEQLLEAVKDEFNTVNEKVGLSRNELRINDNLLEILKNEIESVKTELDSVRTELEKENDLPKLLKKQLESIKGELELLKIELKDTNDELFSANDQLQRTNEEIENSKLILSSLNKELPTTPSKIKENCFSDKVKSLYNDDENLNDEEHTLFSNKENAIEKVHSLFNDQEYSIENSSNTRNIVDKPVLTKSQNDDNSIKLPGINTMQFYFRDKYENEPPQINETDKINANNEVESLRSDGKNNLYKFTLSDDSINSSELIVTDVDQLNQNVLIDEAVPTIGSYVNEEVNNKEKIIMTLQEWFLMLAKIEEDGAELYKKFSEFSSGKLKSVILGFAQEEFKHKRLMIDLSSNYQFNGIQLNETVAMLSQQQADYVANNCVNINLSSEKEFLQFALQLEKNYIEIYKRQLDIFDLDSNEYKRFKIVIEESRKHMVFIVNILNDLKQTEYSEQIMTMRRVGVQDKE